jgi:hypothetical protein
MSCTSVMRLLAGVSRVGIVDQVYVYVRVEVQSLTTPPFEDVARSRQKKSVSMVWGSVSVKFVLLVV